MKRADRQFIAKITVLLALFAWMPRRAAAADDVVVQARELAYSGKQHHDQALALLKQHLDQEPDDSEARVLYGIVLSWQGRYDESRTQLNQVLAANPTHGDALPALINVEFWSGHPESAETLARTGLARQPDKISLLLAEAKALIKMNRNKEALGVLDHVLALDAANHEARRMRREVTVTTLKRNVEINHTYDWFSDGRNGQLETSLSFSNPVPYGSVITRLNRADRFGEVDYQTEIDYYPHFRPGTYGYINVGYSIHGNLYPSTKVGADLFQSVGHGFELSGGYRRMDFTTGVDIYTFAVAKYYGNFLFTGRGYVVPGSPGTSGTALLSARYFLGSEGLHNYVEFRYSHGASPALAQTTLNLEVLNSSRYIVVFDKSLGRRWVAAFSGGVGQSQQLGLSHLRQYEVSGYLYYRF